jgi:hypothetical protein
MKEMSMKKKLDYREYPKPSGYRSGCKVSWYYYHDRANADKAAAAAKHNAVIQAGLGFDFGYQAPGSIHKAEGGDNAGMWEVCIP